MKLNYNTLLNRAGQMYGLAKKEKGCEVIPDGIVSDQVKVLLRLLVRYINELDSRIEELENK